MTGTLNIPRKLLRTLLDAADAGISIREEDALDTGADAKDREAWAQEVAEWSEATTAAWVLLQD